MTTPNDSTNNRLGSFQVNVAPVDNIRAADLKTLLSTFRTGGTEPLILGQDGKPEAAVIPFAAFVRLLKHDHATATQAEGAFQGELRARIADQAPDAPDTSVEDLARSLGSVGAHWADDRKKQGD